MLTVIDQNVSFHQVLLLHYVTLFALRGRSALVRLKVWTLRLLEDLKRHPRYSWLVLVEVGIAAEGRY